MMQESQCNALEKCDALFDLTGFFERLLLAFWRDDVRVCVQRNRRQRRERGASP